MWNEKSVLCALIMSFNLYFAPIGLRMQYFLYVMHLKHWVLYLKTKKNTNNKSHNLISVSLHKGLLLNCNQIVKEIPRNTKKKSPDMRPEIVLPQDMFNLHDNGWGNCAKAIATQKPRSAWVINSFQSSHCAAAVSQKQVHRITLI